RRRHRAAGAARRLRHRRGAGAAALARAQQDAARPRHPRHGAEPDRAAALRHHLRHRRGACRRGRRALRRRGADHPLYRRQPHRQVLRHRHHRRARQPACRGCRRAHHRHRRGGDGALSRAHLHRRHQLRPAGGDPGGAAGALAEDGVMARWWAILIGAAALATVPFLGDEVMIQYGINTLLLAVLAQSWNILGGFTGYASFGNSTFYGLGTYGTAIAMAQFGLPFWVGLILGAVLAMLCALLVGLPILRLRGPYFAIATLGLSAAL